MKLKNFKLRNIYHFIQGHYRAFIIRRFNEFNLVDTTSTKLVKYSNCVGHCKDCGCPLTELILSDKTCDKCQ